MAHVVPRLESMQYDGTNGAAVLEWLSGTADLISDDGQTLQLGYCGSQYEVPAGGYVVGSGNIHSFYSTASADDYVAAYTEITPS